MRGALVALALVSACAKTVNVEAPEPPPPLVEEPPPPPEATDPTVPRRELEAVLAAGPAQFLDRVRVRAFRPEGRFRGWEIVGFGSPGEPIARVLALGDVVTSVNGKPLERPEQFAVVWEELRGVTTIVVELNRRGTPARLVFPVVGP